MYELKVFSVYIGKAILAFVLAELLINGFGIFVNCIVFAGFNFAGTPFLSCVKNTVLDEEAWSFIALISLVVAGIRIIIELIDDAKKGNI